MLQVIDEQRDPDGHAPEPLRGAANLLQRVMTEWLWMQPRQRVLEHLIFCERQLGFRTEVALARIVGSGAATFDGYEGPYRPFQRERSMMFMPPNAVFDFGSDARRRFKRWGYQPGDIEHVFVSHSHADHFNAAEIIAWSRARAAENMKPLHVYAGLNSCRELKKTMTLDDEPRLTVHELTPGRQVEAGELHVLPVEATHDPHASPLCYIARWRGATVYYGTDTAYPRALTFEALKRERFTLFAHELTACSSEDHRDHMDVGDYHLLLGLLREAGAIRRHTRVVSIHQAHEGPYWLPDYNYFQSVIGFECTWDGMPLPIAYRVEDRTDAVK
jgi:phosphoribosyl 1,2-cyclic phosphodiesterase